MGSFKKMKQKKEQKKKEKLVKPRDKKPKISYRLKTTPK